MISICHTQTSIQHQKIAMKQYKNISTVSHKFNTSKKGVKPSPNSLSCSYRTPCQTCDLLRRTPGMSPSLDSWLSSSPGLSDGPIHRNKHPMIRQSSESEI